jgi:hypothetical protein
VDAFSACAIDTMDSVSLSCSARWWSSIASAVAVVVVVEVVGALRESEKSWDRRALVVDAVSVALGVACCVLWAVLPRARSVCDMVVPVGSGLGGLDIDDVCCG